MLTCISNINNLLSNLINNTDKLLQSHINICVALYIELEPCCVKCLTPNRTLSLVNSSDKPRANKLKFMKRLENQ